jgi:deazaflavin-dependent oxidoreductase (nitroreductase family)
VPLPRWLARANKAGLNRVMKYVAPWAPNLGLVVHRGRRSGRRYETPVMLFREGDAFIISLTYGGDRTEWVKNVLAAGGCELRTGGRVLTVTAPRVYHDETRPGVGPLKRRVLELIGAADFLSLK